MNMTRLETFVNLGYTKDPLKGHLYETGDMVRTRRILTMAVESRAMISIVGERGCGKSEAVNAALKKLVGSDKPVKTVWVTRGDQEKLTISDIKTSMILNLSAENVKRGGIVSSMQLRRVIGEASRKQKIVIAIEEAQRLHPSTLKSLKTLREIEWMGETELFTIILVAQSDPMNRPGVSEVKLRSDIVRMQGLSANEAAHYVREAIGKHFAADAIELLAELPQARNYLELQALSVELLNTALAAGREQVTVADVHTIHPPASAPIPRSAPKKTVAAPTGATVLSSVLDRRQGRIEQLSGVTDVTA
ncbi:MAG: ATP-binding protein [Desulfuromonadaceae bacterium]|nr:ATP-binding protein [Desulfuromonadaceae bacterium]